MYTADYHTHSHASPDGHVSIAELAEAAVAAGLDELCITDHAECHGFFDRGNLPDDVLYFYQARVDAEFPETRERFDGRLRLLYGVEIAQGHEAPAVYDDLIHRNYDFVINSLHNLRGETDFYYMKDFRSAAYCRTLLDRYVGELYETAALGGFDVIGHIGYPLRYMRYQAGFDVSLDAYRAELAEIFRLLVSKGCGIELNVSGLRDGGQVTFPTLAELKLYRECGGEIVTIGSDAHYPRYVGVGVEQGQALLREAGFRFITAYDKRVPRFVAL